jgi:hypothetical protein
MSATNSEHCIQVECGMGRGIELEPRRLHIARAVYDVVRVLDRWYEGPHVAGGPTRHYFKVRTRGGSCFLVAHVTPSDAWFLVKAFGPEVPPGA